MESENVSRKMGIVTANLMFVEIPVTLVKLVIMLLKTRIILAAEAAGVMLEDPSARRVPSPGAAASAGRTSWGRPVGSLKKTIFSLICTR